MDFLDFSDVLFLPNSSIGELYEDLNTIVEQDICYDTFQFENTKWLWLVNDIVTTLTVIMYDVLHSGFSELCRWNPKLCKKLPISTVVR
jgi:hypothetical protein